MTKRAMMKRFGMMTPRRRSLSWRHVLVALWLAACGGALGTRSAGGESHFLRECVDSCGQGLECVSGLCTRGCLVGEDECTELSPRAVCTDESIEPGALAVCDVSCESDADCAALGADFKCDGGFCRGSVLPELGAGGGSAGTGTGGTGVPDPFAPQCAEPLNFTSECSFDETCDVLGCGNGVSQFDASGCVRYCQTSADCNVGERCRYTALVLKQEECGFIGSDVEGCRLEDGVCNCSWSADCFYPDVCVDAEQYPETLDCVVEDASCTALAFAPLSAPVGSPPEMAEAFEACRELVEAQQLSRGCPTNP